MSVARLAGFEDGIKPAFSSDFGSASYAVSTVSPRSGTYHARMAAQSAGAGAALGSDTALSAVDGWTWAGFWYKLNGVVGNLSLSSTARPVASVGCPTSGIRAYIAIFNDGRVGAAFHNSLFPGIAPGNQPGWVSDWRFPPDMWVHFEIGWAPADAGGRCVIRANGQTIVDITGDTKGTGTLTTARSLWLYGPYSTATADFDDITITVEDGVGSQDFQGPGSIDATPTFTAEPAGSLRLSALAAEVMSTNNLAGSLRLSGLAIEVMSEPATGPDLLVLDVAVGGTASEPTAVVETSNIITLDAPGGSTSEPTLATEAGTDILLLEHISGGTTYEPTVAASSYSGFIMSMMTCPPTFEQQNLSLYTIDGYWATLPPGEEVVASYDSLSTFLTEVTPTWQGQQVQVAISNEILIYEGRFISGAWVWTEILDV